jgi:hypothetical protein
MSKDFGLPSFALDRPLRFAIGIWALVVAGCGGADGGGSGESPDGNGASATDMASMCGCDPNATCTQAGAVGSTCACNAGFSGNGLSCTDIDECMVNNGGCDSNAACTNTPGSRTCTCNPGYSGNGLTCSDIDECLTNNGGCDPHATCTNTLGSRTCSCDNGYSGNGLTCTDINECLTNNGGCDPNAACMNTPGSRSCSCKPGYSGDGFSCVDVNECLTNNGGCDPNATCTNTPGSRTCACNAGYSGNGLSCADIDECLTNNGGCDPNATCTNTPGSRTCACNSGYSGDEMTCTDIDECLTNNGGCDLSATCTNTPGSRTCTCGSGNQGDGIVCVAPWTIALGGPGTDIALSMVNTPDNDIGLFGYSIGSFEGHTAGASNDAIWASVSLTGTLLSSQQVPGAGAEYAIGGGFDSSGNVFVGGIQQAAGSNMDIDTYVEKRDSAGNIVWRRLIGTDGNDYVGAVAFDPSTGETIVVGTLETSACTVIKNSRQGTCIFDIASSSTFAGGQDAFYFVLGPTGNVLTAFVIGTSGTEQGKAAAISNGTYFVAGSTTGNLFGHSNSGAEDVWIAGVRSTQFGTAGSDIPIALALDSKNDLFVTGVVQDQSQDIFVTAFGPTGTQLWSTTAVNDGFDEQPAGIAVDQYGSTYVAGYTHGQFSTTMSAGLTDCVVMRFAPSGAVASITQFGTADYDTCTGIVLAPSRTNDTIVSVTSYGPLDGVASSGEQDIYLKRLWVP